MYTRKLDSQHRFLHSCKCLTGRPFFSLYSANRGDYAWVQSFNTPTIQLIVLGFSLLKTLAWAVAPLKFQWWHIEGAIKIFVNIKNSSNYSWTPALNPEWSVLVMFILGTNINTGQLKYIRVIWQFSWFSHFYVGKFLAFSMMFPVFKTAIIFGVCIDTNVLEK